MRNYIGPPMQTSGSRRRYLKRLVLIVAMVVLCGLAFVILGSTGTAYNAAARSACTANLKSINVALRNHLSKGGSPPLTEDGGLTLTKLLENSPSLNVFPCSAHSEDIDAIYLVAPGLIEQLNTNSQDQLPTILIYDRPGNHIIRRANGLKKRIDGQVQETGCLLLSNGEILYWRGDAVAYADWATGFSSGNPNEPQYPPGIEERLREYVENNSRATN